MLTRCLSVIIDWPIWWYNKKSKRFCILKDWFSVCCCFLLRLDTDRSSTGSKGRKQVISGLNRRTAMRSSTLLGILTAVLAYLVMGALVFNKLEGPYEEAIHQLFKKTLQKTQEDFLENYTCVNPNILQELIEVQEKIIQAVIPI